MQTRANPSAKVVGNQTRLLGAFAGFVVAGIFLFFTWGGLSQYFTGDDLMNLYGYWTKPVGALIKGNVFFWTPYYRPFGGIVYRVLFAIFGFNPRPLYILFYAAMLLNLWLAYLLFKRLGRSREIAAIAVLLWAYHGKFDYLYYNAGSMYDVFCFLFFSLALLIYLRPRAQGRFPGLWDTLGFLVCLICALNSKEMGATLPVIVLLYELIFHPPDFRRIGALTRWCINEGRIPLLGALIVLIYIPGKLGSGGLAQDTAYLPSYTLSRWLEDTGTYIAHVLYHNNPSLPLGVTPFSPFGVAVFFGVLAAVAIWLRSRLLWFGLLFFAIAALPVSFIPARLGFVLYLPLTGLALYAAVCLVRFKERLWKLISEDFGEGAHKAAASSPISASVVLFLSVALLISVIDYRNWSHAPGYSPYRSTMGELSRFSPTIRRGGSVLFVHSALDSTWDMVFLLRLYYRDPSLFITELNGPPPQRIPLDRLPRYDRVFDYENGQYEELDNADAIASVKLHLVKVIDPDHAFGESMTIGKPGAAQYVVKDVLVGDSKSDGFWTLDQPELRFRLSSVQHHVFREHFYLPLETLKVTGPLQVDFFVNGHLLDRADFAKDGEVLYTHDVPGEWLNTVTMTTVKMLVRNPYVAPRDHAKLGFILRSAGFSSSPAQS